MAIDGFSACGATAQPAHKSVESATTLSLNVLRFSVVFFMPQRTGASRFLLLLVGGILLCCCRGDSRYLFRGDSLNFGRSARPLHRVWIDRGRCRTVWIANAHCDDRKRFVVCADEKVTAF